MKDNSRLTAKELDNIKLSYEQYGAEHLDHFIQAIWKEAYDIGKEDGKNEKSIPSVHPDWGRESY